MSSQSTINANRYLAVFFNLDQPLFTKNVRQALAYASRKPTDDTRAIGPIATSSWAYLEGGKDYQFDQERAVERLLSEPPAETLNFELATLPQFEAEANQLKQEWEELGAAAYASCQKNTKMKDKTVCDKSRITVTIRIASFADTSSFQALLIGQESPTDPDQYYLWHSDQPSNFTHFRNTRIDSLLEKGRQTTDRNERLAIYGEFQQFLLEDVPAIFIKYLPTYQVTRK